MKPRLVDGRPRCVTLYDARGTAHLQAPELGKPWNECVCGRTLEDGGVKGRLRRNCQGCAEGARLANQKLWSALLEVQNFLR